MEERPTLTDEEHFCLQGCRKYDQYYKMRQGFEAGMCAFCKVDRNLNQILWECGTVMLWKVPDKYLRKELALHVLIVPKRHIRFEADMTDAEVLGVHRAKCFVRDELHYQGGMSHVREGNMQLNAGTVPHLHYNIFQPNQTGEVRIPVFKDPSDRDTNIARAEIFSTCYEAGELPK